MSGGSGSGSGFDDWRPSSDGGKAGGGGGSGGGVDKCAIYERAVLASPVASVIATLNAGDPLTVELETAPRNRIVVKTAAGLVAGAITSVRLVDMIECMSEGYAYAAEVVSISGGRVEVDINPA